MEGLSKFCGGRGRRQRCGLDHVVRVPAKVQVAANRETLRLCLEEFAEPEFRRATAGRLLTADLRRSLSATDKEMQVAPHQPQEAVCVDKRGFRECLGSAGGERCRTTSMRCISRRPPGPRFTSGSCPLASASHRLASRQVLVMAEVDGTPSSARHVAPRSGRARSASSAAYSPKPPHRKRRSSRLARTAGSL